MQIGDQTAKFKRESADTTNTSAANSAATSAPAAAETLSESAKALKNKLIGTWLINSSPIKYVFTADNRVLIYSDGHLQFAAHYQIKDDKVEWLNNFFKKISMKTSFGNDDSAMNFGSIRMKLESRETNVDFSDSLPDRIVGLWVGIPGTNTDMRTISVLRDAPNNYSWSLGRQRKGWFHYKFEFSADGTAKFGATIRKLTVEDDVLTSEENGEIEKYPRLKTVD
ncbi:MAG: hypothetical protein IPN69_13245 [Acidobacteria bacterium]|nr:hypothetical protein [Acidobacteriota bacterium]